MLILELLDTEETRKVKKERENQPCYRVWELFFTAGLSQEEFIISWRCGFSSALSGTTEALLSL